MKSPSDFIDFPYTMEITPNTDGGFFISIKELPGCMSEGDTVEEAIEMINDAKSAWISTALNLGREIPLPKVLEEEKDYSGKFVLRVPKSLHKRLSENAESEGVSLNSYAFMLLAENDKKTSELHRVIEHLTFQLQKAKGALSGSYPDPTNLNTEVAETGGR